jgi:uncharacterized membrane protein YGL010W
MALGTARSWDDWIREYGRSHEHPVNRVCHTIGIPMIALAVPLAAVAVIWRALWPVPVALFVVGWIFQFVGHAFERKPPEFLKDWRFLFVGLRWWFAKVGRRSDVPPRP